jgi:hypothetical protein
MKKISLSDFDRDEMSGFKLTLQSDDNSYEPIIIERYFDDPDNQILKNATAKCCKAMELISNTLIEYEKTAKGGNCEQNEYITMVAINKRKEITSTSYSVKNFKDETKYNINVKALVPDIVKIFKEKLHI